MRTNMLSKKMASSSNRPSAIMHHVMKGLKKRRRYNYSVAGSHIGNLTPMLPGVALMHFWYRLKCGPDKPARTRAGPFFCGLVRTSADPKKMYFFQRLKIVLIKG